mmetsp:Transcript_13227/g.24777  ORF Transcript_13227/g.24777 Transcript_13227/m.24777 type:complete len:107 (-) Transcript_13227:1412-1732(-)
MSNQIESLRVQGRLSMENLVQRAKVQDSVLASKKWSMTLGNRTIGTAMILPMAGVFFYSLFKHSQLHKYYTLTFDNFVLLSKRSLREIYAPEIYSKDKRLYKLRLE